MASITDIVENAMNVGRAFMSITVFDVIDIFLMAAIIYMILRFITSTRAEQLLKGIIIVVLLIWALATLFQLKVMSFLLENFLQVAFIAIVIVFQPELRGMLERVGNNKVVNNFGIQRDQGNSLQSCMDAIESIVYACTFLSNTCTGALIVIEGDTKLDDIVSKVNNATVVDAALSGELLASLFYNKSPLHDGAVIIRENRIYAAGCMLPSTSKGQYLASNLGSRHRAAVGMSENASDAIVLVVSEETGTISVAKNGVLSRNLSSETLRKVLNKELYEPLERANKKKEKRSKQKRGNTEN